MDKTMGRGAQVRLYSGALQNRQAVGESKVTQIRTLRGTRWEDRGALSAGEIGMVYGLGDVRPGDVLGDASLVPEGRLRTALAEPLLSSRVEPEDEKDLRALREALEELSIEDPHLDAQWSSFTPSSTCASPAPSRSRSCKRSWRSASACAAALRRRR